MKVLIALIFACSADKAFCWGSFAHQTAGEIAERYITKQTRMALNELLGPEKLAFTSTWADMVRDDPDFDQFKNFHFIDSLKSDAKSVIVKYPEILRDPNVERSVKIPALRYLVHVVEDVHQPLHTGISDDMGGNFCKVEWLPGKIFNLHEIWDGKIIEYDVAMLRSAISPLKFYSFDNYAEFILKNSALTMDEISKLQSVESSTWIKESQSFESSVYPENTSSGYCQKMPAFFPKISDDYKIKAINISRQRILYAGLRLAGMLNQIFKDGAHSGKDSSLDKNQILQKLSIQ